MKRVVHLYGGMALITLRREWRRWLRNFGERLKQVGRQLVTLGEDSTPRWSIELFHRCYLADAEFHFGTEIFRGPMYAAFATGGMLSFRLNWLAKRTDPYGEWEYPHGEGVLNLKLKDYSPPYEIETGDIWFTFNGGYAILYLGNPRQSLEFKGPAYALRAFTYF
jgi:hypothetical protein